MASDRLDHGTAGASARREHLRRAQHREDAARARHPRIAAQLLALNEPPAHVRAWAHGAAGEELVAQALEMRCRPEVVLLHDRATPGSRANIDHLAVAPSGVWVIDTKRYKGRIEVAKPLFGPARLKIGGRDRTRLVDSLERLVTLVDASVRGVAPAVQVHGAFCFVEGELPLLGTPVIRGFPLVHRRSLAKRLNADGPLTVDELLPLAAALAAAFPRA
jgi:hypothetical protein